MSVPANNKPKAPKSSKLERAVVIARIVPLEVVPLHKPKQKKK
jgi:hypothetical protein